jgi:hypothetical protein
MSKEDKVVPIQKPRTTPLLQASGTIKVIDKDGNVKSEMEITSIQVKEAKKDGIT